MYKVAILAFDGVATFELGCAVELFALSRPEIDNWYTGQVVTFDDRPINATGGFILDAPLVYNLREFDMLVVPSWPLSDAPLSLDLEMAIMEFVAQKKRIVSFCSGAFLLGELGLLNGKQATTHWLYAEEFKARFPDTEYVDDVLYVYDGRLGCSAGSAAGIDLGLEIIRKDFSFETANLVARRLVMPPHRSGGQSQFVETPMDKRPSAFAESLDWAIKNLAVSLKVEDLADRANMSRRSFDRHFRQKLNMSPLEWLSQQKLKRAQQLLESTHDSIEMIAHKSGFNNALTLRHNFHKTLSISPTQYRQQFGNKSKKS